jgi:large subunit ribosomal protein L22e
MAILKKKVVSKNKNNLIKFVIDCAQPVEDKVLTTKDFEEFLRKKIKVDGKVGNMGEDVALSSSDSKITVTSSVAFSKRYLKYLSKKYLKKNQLRDFIHVIASDKNTYVLKYFDIQ